MTQDADRDHDLRMIRLHAEWLRRRGKTDATRQHRRAALLRLSEALTCPLLEATEDILEDWQAGLQVSLSSVATYTSHVRAFYDWAESTKRLETSPARNLPMPSIASRLPRPIPEDDFLLALGCAPEPMATWLLLAGSMGLRAMEIAGIGRESVTEVAGRLVISGVGKGGKPFALPVPAQVAPYLQAHLSGPAGALWRTADGDPITGYKLSRTANRFLRSLGLGYTLHSLRHRFGTALYAATKDLALVQDLMRHGTPSTTRLYVAIGGERGAEAMDQLSAPLARARRVAS